MATVELDANVRRQAEALLARIHPCLLLRHVHCVDNTSGDDFRFHFSPEQLIRYASTPNEIVQTVLPVDAATRLLQDGYEDTGWEWQGDLIDWWINTFVTIILKARQLGITWCASGVGLWFLTQRPGTKVLVQSIGEDESATVTDHVWEMWESLQESAPHLTRGLKVERPTNNRRPHMDIEIRHPDGKISSFVAQPSTTAKGHSMTASFVILDEFSRHPYARDAWKAVIPTTGGSKRARGRTAIISTGNGVSVDEEGGNFFHHLWQHSKIYRLERRFLKWNENPDRDDDWYEAVAMKLPSRDRGEQYPNTPEEAFILTGDVWFDYEDLEHYSGKVRDPLYAMDWVPVDGDKMKAKQRRSDWGNTDVFLEPMPGHLYAIGADTSTGYGRDFTCAYVVDLSSKGICAEYHARSDADLVAEQLHYLGRWYGRGSGLQRDALIAIERGGGWGEAVQAQLRDGKDGRPRYTNLYRHRPDHSVELDQARSYGYPVNSSTRPLLISGIEKALRERTLPWVTLGLLDELRTFVKRKKHPSPAAADGCHDDRVMALGITLDLFRQYGAHADARRRRQPPQQRTPYPF